MAAGHLWATSDDGSIEYRSLTKEYLDAALTIMSDAFFKHENVCTAIGLANNPEAIQELLELSLRAARTGVTIIAIDKASNKVAGAAFNMLQVNSSSNEMPYFEQFEKICKYPESKAVVRFMIDFDNLVNLFELCQIDCLLEIMFLGTLSEFRGKGIAKKLCEVSIEVGRKLLNGENVKQAIDDSVLTLEPVPKAASAIYTSFISQRIGKQLGFQVATEKDYSDFEYQGRRYSDVVTNTKTITLEYLKF